MLQRIQPGAQFVNLALLLLDPLLELVVLVDDVPHLVLRGRAGEGCTAGLGEKNPHTDEAEKVS